MASRQTPGRIQFGSQTFFQAQTGWWFGTFFFIFHILGIIIPIDFHIFQGLKPPTRLVWQCGNGSDSCGHVRLKKEQNSKILSLFVYLPICLLVYLSINQSIYLSGPFHQLRFITSQLPRCAELLHVLCRSTMAARPECQPALLEGCARRWRWKMTVEEMKHHSS